MRKLKLQVQMSTDGFIAGPNGEMDWMVWDWDEQLKAFVSALTEPVDCIVLGRKLAQGFIPHWAAAAADAANSADPEMAFTIKMNETTKVVFSKTIHQSEWDHAAVQNGDLVESIQQLKNQPGGDIIVYGGASFVSSLVKEGLIDHYYLFVNPVLLGQGMPIFQDLDAPQRLIAGPATSFSCGISCLEFEKRG